jgi:hypothetical protein
MGDEASKNRSGKVPVQNPVRGCLLIGRRSPANNLLFVFRRLELRNSAKPALASRVVKGFIAADAAPPKNKKGKVLVGGRIYKQATPNGVSICLSV